MEKPFTKAKILEKSFTKSGFSASLRLKFGPNGMPDPNPDHSAHMGTFALNPWTGDVWSTAGSCSRLASSKLVEMLKSIRTRSKLAAAEFERHSAKKPICDADQIRRRASQKKRIGRGVTIHDGSWSASSRIEACGNFRGRVVLIVFLLAAHGLIVPALHLLIPDARADTVTYAYDALGRYGLAIAAVAAVGWRRKYG
jgi:hypothetical protein